MTATDGDAFEVLQRFADVWHDKYDHRHASGGENRKPPSLTMRAGGVAAVLTEPQLQAVVAEYARMREEREDPEQGACVCGGPDCMPYWRPVHEQMNAMRVQADRNAADFTKVLLEEICELRTELDQLRAKLAHSESVVAAFHAEADRMSDRYDNLRDDYDRARVELEQVRAQRADEQDGDVRTLVRLLDLIECDPESDYAAAITAVRDRYADQIAALDARDAAAGGVQPNGDPIREEQ